MGDTLDRGGERTHDDQLAVTRGAVHERWEIAGDIAVGGTRAVHAMAPRRSRNQVGAERARALPPSLHRRHSRIAV